MTKTDLIAAVTEKSGASKKDTAAVIESTLQVITDTLKSGDKVIITGFGTFETTKKEARTGRNPHTGETIDIPARISPKFKPGSVLKNAVK